MNPRVLSAAFAAGWREKLRYPGDMLGAAFFLCLLVFVFGRLWTAVEAQRGLPGGWSVKALVLYLVVAELVIMSPGALHQRVGSDVRSGDLAVALLRPVGWISWELARAAGAALARMLVLGVAGGSAAAFFHGLPPLDARGVAVGILLVPLAVLLECAARLGIGVLAFWLEDANAFYWIWQKLGFVLGGLMMPLDLYPTWLRDIARVLPFEAAIGGPARIVAAFDPSLALHALLRLGAWSLAALLALGLVHRRAIRSVQLNGG